MRYNLVSIRYKSYVRMSMRSMRTCVRTCVEHQNIHRPAGLLYSTGVASIIEFYIELRAERRVGACVDVYTDDSYRDIRTSDRLL